MATLNLYRTNFFTDIYLVVPVGYSPPEIATGKIGEVEVDRSTHAYVKNQIASGKDTWMTKDSRKNIGYRIMPSEEL